MFTSKQNDTAFRSVSGALSCERKEKNLDNAGEVRFNITPSVLETSGEAAQVRPSQALCHVKVNSERGVRQSCLEM